ncbi:hypothetical protein [Desulfuromonas sp. TF]|uniref:hypothetical protein n=1 Tax=Desulfuromonas sp. TF TaxID=1232410 RepID=UPI0012DF08A0|nr:hypothetical protein [Desulfuromonas sp. TF]
MAKFLILTVSIIIMSACSPTPKAMRLDAPVSVYTSNKEPKDIAICITEKWENTRVIGGSLDVDFHPTENGYCITQKISGKLYYLADIENSQNGSLTKLYKWNMVMSIGENTSIVGVAECQL